LGRHHPFELAFWAQASHWRARHRFADPTRRHRRSAPRAGH